MAKYINEEKLVDALRATGRDGELIELLVQADVLESRLSQKTEPNYYRICRNVEAFCCSGNYEMGLQRVAHRMIGFLSSMKEAGFYVLTQYVPADEEIEALREIEDTINNVVSEEAM